MTVWMAGLDQPAPRVLTVDQPSTSVVGVHGSLWRHRDSETVGGESPSRAAEATVDLPLTCYSRSAARPDQAGFVGEDHRLGAVSQRELAENPADVCLHRLLGDDQVRGDLRVGAAAGQ